MKKTTSRWWLLLEGLAGLFLFCGVGLAALFFLPGEARTLRDAMLDAELERPQTLVQMHLGEGTFSFVRLLVACAKETPQEVDAALRSIEEVAVGVYRLGKKGAGRPNLIELDRQMRRKGWNRLLTLREKGHYVVGYTPEGDSGGKIIPLCLAVRDADTLVIVSARTSVEPLLELVRRDCSHL